MRGHLRGKTGDALMQAVNWNDSLNLTVRETSEEIKL